MAGLVCPNRQLDDVSGPGRDSQGQSPTVLGLLVLALVVIPLLLVWLGVDVEVVQAQWQLVSTLCGASLWYSLDARSYLFESRGDVVFKFRFRDYAYPTPDYYHRRHGYRCLPRRVRLHGRLYHW